MVSEAILDLEDLCGSPLPAGCRTVLTDYPSALRGAVRAEDGTDSEGLVSENELIGDPVEVLRINREVRSERVLDPEGREFCWPPKFLVIGETGEGDYYCVDIDGEHEGVLQFRHHAVEFEEVAETLDEFIEMLVECFVTGDESDLEDLDDSDIEEPE